MTRQPPAGDASRTLSLLTATLESTADGILVVDSAGHVTTFNRKFAEQWRLPAALLEAGDDARMLEYVLEQLRDPDAFLAKVHELYAHPHAESVDVLHFKDGRVFERLSQPQRLDGDIVGRVWSFRDISARRSTEEALRQSEERFRALVEHSSDAVALLDVEGRFRYVSPSVVRVLGYHPDELTGQPAINLIHPEDVARTRAMFAPIGAGSAPVTGEVRARHKDGSVRVIEGVVANRLDDPGVGAIVANFRDVTERHRAERLQAAVHEISEAANSATSLRDLLATIHRIVTQLMPATNFYVALVDDAAGMVSFPYFVDEMDPSFPPKALGKGLTEYVYRTGEPLLATPDVYNELVRRGEVELIGAPSIDWVGVPLKSGDKCIGVVVAQTYTEGVRYGETERQILQFVSAQIARAIERRRAAELLLENEHKYRLLFETNPEAMFVFARDEDFRILAVNDAAVHRYGWPRDEFLALTALDIRPDAERAEAQRRLQRTEVGPRFYTGIHHRKRDGSSFEVEVLMHPIEFAGRQAHLALARDVTERRRLEEQLRQAQKMEAVGQLAGGIAHDFNNILTAILGTTQLLMRDVAKDHAMHDDLEEIRKAATRAADLTRQLLAYSRRQVLAPKVLDLNGVVSNLDPMLRRLIGEDVELATILAHDLAPVRADPSQLEQILLNLAVNARDAMPNGGRLTVETTNATLDESYAQEHPTLVPGEFVLLAVSDTGVGMDADTKAHLFEPFFTTKAPGKGTGLGLATVYGVVKQSGGHIWVYSEPNQGTTFKIYLPSAKGAVERSDTPAAAARTARATETVLLVEDEPAVRTFARKTLELAGYKVLTAENGPAALAVAERHAGSIHLLLTDVVMPGMSGRVLAERLLAQRPAILVLYTSGYTDDAIVRHGVLDAKAAFLQKPFSPEALELKVREVLDGGSANA